ncbi:hypothetical protein BSM4216_2721 [Bacillus smithii]|nr:hypothetical protein BSM4216_2721 [Bacillus smithii]
MFSLILPRIRPLDSGRKKFYLWLTYYRMKEGKSVCRR